MHEDVTIFPEELFSFESSTHDIFWHKNLMEKKKKFFAKYSDKGTMKEEKIGESIAHFVPTFPFISLEHKREYWHKVR